jgi:hypothetical protein
MAANDIDLKERVTITLVDQPDLHGVPDDERALITETERTYRIADETARHTVRVRARPGHNRYIVENLIGGRWHRLLEGDAPNGAIPFVHAVHRAAAVLL